MTVERDVSPATEAGQRYWKTWLHPSFGKLQQEYALSAILAIEQEAAALERRKVVERIRQSLDLLPYWDKRSVPGGLHVNRNEVRAILDDLGDSR